MTLSPAKWPPSHPRPHRAQRSLGEDRAKETVIARTIVSSGWVIGNILSYVADGKREVGYWISRDYWGRGHGTSALAEFVVEVRERPLFAHVVQHNIGSLRVLAKCGFAVIGAQQLPGDPIREIVMRLDA